MTYLLDTFGLRSPITIKMKTVLQELWMKGKQWDDQIDDSLKERWNYTIEKPLRICDAPGKAYATEIYQ